MTSKCIVIILELIKFFWNKQTLEGETRKLKVELDKNQRKNYILDCLKSNSE